MLTPHPSCKLRVYPLIFNDEAMRSVRPSIIHGDLWSGNSGTDHDTGEPIIFDPSSSYSHNEAELGIMRMFGGYTSDFFDSYHEVVSETFGKHARHTMLTSTPTTSSFADAQGAAILCRTH